METGLCLWARSNFETDVNKLKARESTSGNMDFKELNKIQNVVVGQTLATKVAATRGKGGKTLFGHYLEAKNGKENPVVLGENVEFASDGVATESTGCTDNDFTYKYYSYNGGQARIIGQMQKQQIDDTLDLYLVEETARYVYRIIAAKIMFSNPTAFGFRLRASDLYMQVPYKEVTVKTGITDLAAWAKKQGTTYALLKNLNPWLRDNFLQNVSGRTYILKVPIEEKMHYKANAIVPHDKRWVVQ